jgi:uncharacterized protein (DUF1697 family)
VLAQQKRHAEVKEALKKAIESELARAHGHLVTISIRKLSIWYPELQKYPLTVRTKALKELIQNEYHEYFIMEWNERVNSDKRYILVRNPQEKEKVLKILNVL